MKNLRDSSSAAQNDNEMGGGQDDKEVLGMTDLLLCHPERQRRVYEILRLRLRMTREWGAE